MALSKEVLANRLSEAKRQAEILKEQFHITAGIIQDLEFLIGELDKEEEASTPPTPKE